MTPRIHLAVIACLALALVAVVPAFAAPPPAQAAATLGVNLSFSPNPVSVGSQTQIQVSITGGTGPFYLWFNTSIPGCSPSSQPTQEPGPTSSFPCNPTSPGTFNAHLDVQDSAGNQGSASATLNVQSGGGGTGSNNTGGIDLSFFQNLLPVLMITGIVFMGSVVAIAASAVALAILVPRRLKQIRKAIQGEPMKKPKAEGPKPEPPKPELPKDDL